jgi:hypothetical protein
MARDGDEPGRQNRPDRQSRREKIAAQQAAALKAERRRRLLMLIGAVIVAAAVVAVIVLNFPMSSTTSSRGPEGITLESGPELASISSAAGGKTVDGISCDASEQVAYHIHTHLAVFVNGQSRSVPYGIGVVQPVPQAANGGTFVSASNCYYWLHTHAADGIIHIESPTEATYTLGLFFDIWGQPLSAGQVGPAKGTVTAYVNGKQYTGNPRDITLQPHEDIQLNVGSPNVPPQSVDWSGSGL